MLVGTWKPHTAEIGSEIARKRRSLQTAMNLHVRQLAITSEMDVVVLYSSQYV